MLSFYNVINIISIYINSTHIIIHTKQKEVIIMSEQSQILIRLPLQKKQQLQIIAIKKNTNMNSILNELINEYLKENG